MRLLLEYKNLLIVFCLAEIKLVSSFSFIILSIQTAKDGIAQSAGTIPFWRYLVTLFYLVSHPSFKATWCSVHAAANMEKDDFKGNVTYKKH